MTTLRLLWDNSAFFDDFIIPFNKSCWILVQSIIWINIVKYPKWWVFCLLNLGVVGCWWLDDAGWELGADAVLIGFVTCTHRQYKMWQRYGFGYWGYIFEDVRFYIIMSFLPYAPPAHSWTKECYEGHMVYNNISPFPITSFNLPVVLLVYIYHKRVLQGSKMQA